MSRDLHDAEAERAVLGCVLLHQEAVLVALEHIAPEDFGDHSHAKIFDVMRGLVRSKKPIDIVTVAGELDARDQLERVGGRASLLQFVESVPTASNIGYYAERVRGRSRLRKLARLAQSISEEAACADDADTYIASAQSKLLSLTEDVRGDLVSADQWALNASKRIEERARTGQVPGLATGIAGIDRAGGLRGLTILAARPSMGKSAFAQNVAINVAEQGCRVLLVSIEMEEDEVTDRFVGMRSLVNTRQLERPSKLEPPQWQRINDELRMMSELDLDLWIASDVTIDALRTRALRAHALRPIDLVIIDYLQLMRGTSRENRTQDVSSITRGLKVLSKELGAPVLALSQLNRAVEQRESRIPELSDLRESGSIEQDANVVAFIVRPHLYDQSADPTEAIVRIAKYRSGEIGSFKMRFDARFQRFEEANP